METRINIMDAALFGTSLFALAFQKRGEIMERSHPECGLPLVIFNYMQNSNRVSDFLSFIL
jgi:hypothetical protein